MPLSRLFAIVDVGLSVAVAVIALAILLRGTRPGAPISQLYKLSVAGGLLYMQVALWPGPLFLSRGDAPRPARAGLLDYAARGACLAAAVVAIAFGLLLRNIAGL